MITQDTCEPYYKTLDDPWTNSYILLCKKHGVVGYLNSVSRVRPEIIMASLRGIFDEHIKNVSGQKIVEATIDSLPVYLL